MRDITVKIENSGSTAEGRHSAAEFNGVYRDTRDAVLRAGLTLDNADQTQVSQSEWIHGNSSSIFIATGSANAIIATPLRGATGPKLPPSLDNMDGTIIEIDITNQNTSAVTINVGQTTSSLLGVKKITLSDGTDLSPRHLFGHVRLMYSLLGDGGNGAWILLSNSMANEAGDQINLPYVPTSSEMLRRRILHRDGSSVLRTDFPLLFAKIGVIYGNADATHFNLPDDRGLFERMTDGGAGIDPDAATRTDRGDGTTGDNVGTKQDSENKSHTHIITTYSTEQVGDGAGYGRDDNSSNIITTASGGNESRPKNIYKWGGIFY